jgi:hypothetical protein
LFLNARQIPPGFACGPVSVFSGVRQQIFAGAGHLLAQLLPQKLHQQNLRLTSKIINPIFVISREET